MPKEQIEREIEAHRLVIEFLVTGKCPPGIRPEVMELCADIIAATPPCFSPKLSGYRYIVTQGPIITCMTDDPRTASRWGRVKKNFLRLVH